MSNSVEYKRLGALVTEGGTLFRVWSPLARQLAIELENGTTYPMTPGVGGYFELHIEGVGAGAHYRVRLNGNEPYPDPASRFQPDGVHGPSMVVDPSLFPWRDESWTGIARRDLVFYELHVGTFSPEGTFDGVRRKLPYLRDLGITAVELMPIADFPGRRNWGYDHAALYAPARVYGTPDDLRRLVDEAHVLGLSVFLDVIYNHLGPDGAYLAAFAPMFTEKHRTPWGMAINLDDVGSDGVRNLFVDNALHWLKEYHIDGLRLDATHALVDDSPTHFLEELAASVARVEEGPRRILVAEDSRNLNRIILSPEHGGYGLDAVWSDDFHHQIRHLTTGDSEGYYRHFVGMESRELADTIERGWFYDGRPSRHSGKSRGTDASLIEPDQCVFCIQNHDQIGNRPAGDRLNHVIAPELFRTASALLLFAPELPLLFMGQEWSAGTPFQFFTDHHEELGTSVTEGRKREFEDFSGFGREVPDPQSPDTFSRSRLDWRELEDETHAATLRLYRDLLSVRRELTGSAKCLAFGAYCLSVRRGPFELVAAFRDGQVVAVGAGTRSLLHTEDSRYVSDGVPPEMHDGMLRFHRAGAVILRHES